MSKTTWQTSLAEQLARNERCKLFITVIDSTEINWLFFDNLWIDISVKRKGKNILWLRDAKNPPLEDPVSQIRYVWPLPLSMGFKFYPKYMGYQSLSVSEGSAAESNSFLKLLQAWAIWQKKKQPSKQLPVEKMLFLWVKHCSFHLYINILFILLHKII